MVFDDELYYCNTNIIRTKWRIYPPEIAGMITTDSWDVWAMGGGYSWLYRSGYVVICSRKHRIIGNLLRLHLLNSRNNHVKSNRCLFIRGWSIPKVNPPDLLWLLYRLPPHSHWYDQENSKYESTILCERNVEELKYNGA